MLKCKGGRSANAEMQEDSDWFFFFFFGHSCIWCNAGKSLAGLVMAWRRVVICMISQHKVAAGKGNCTDCSPSRRERDESLGLGILFHEENWNGVGNGNGLNGQGKWKKDWCWSEGYLTHSHIFPLKDRLQRNWNLHTMKGWNEERMKHFQG